MGLKEASAAMLALESAKPFDYGKAGNYQVKLQQYVAEKNSLFPGRPLLFDVTEGSVSLPVELQQRIDGWMTNHPQYSPFMRTFAKYYLIGLLSDESSYSSMCRHVVDCIVDGGDFYIETGFFYLRDAAAVSGTSR
jgi:hypothetical protein